MKFHVTSEADVLGPVVEAETREEAARLAVKSGLCTHGVVTVRWNVRPGKGRGTWDFARVAEITVEAPQAAKAPEPEKAAESTKTPEKAAEPEKAHEPTKTPEKATEPTKTPEKAAEPKKAEAAEPDAKKS